MLVPKTEDITKTRPVSRETAMLTPHEVATLMLIEVAAPNIKDLDREAVDALIDQQLVDRRIQDAGTFHPRITTRGTDILSAIARHR
jgi:hypothetical protein